MKNNALVTMNNDFFVTCEAIRQWFSRVKIIAVSPHERQKIVTHSNECTILFLRRYVMSWTHNYNKNNYRPLISALSLRTVYSDLALWRHHIWYVASRERWALAFDVIFVDFSCTRNLVQKRSSQMNTNREYRFLTTRYPWLSV